MNTIEVDNYIATFPSEVQELLQQVRLTIQKAAPEAVEVVSYGMPAYKIKRILVYFAGCKNHVGFYPTASGIHVFKEEIAKYKWAKGSVQFPYNKPLPLELISRIVRHRVEEITEKNKSKTKKK